MQRHGHIGGFCLTQEKNQNPTISDNYPGEFPVTTSLGRAY